MAFQNSITTVQYNNPLDNALSAVYKDISPVDLVQMPLSVVYTAYGTARIFLANIRLPCTECWYLS